MRYNLSRSETVIIEVRDSSDKAGLMRLRSGQLHLRNAFDDKRNVTVSEIKIVDEWVAMVTVTIILSIMGEDEQFFIPGDLNSLLKAISAKVESLERNL